MRQASITEWDRQIVKTVHVVVERKSLNGWEAVCLTKAVL
jgi:hypothetical protein